MAGWYKRKTPEERRAWVERRDIEKVRAADRARYQRDKPTRNALVAMVLQRHPERRKARAAVAHALHSGKIVRGPCAVCGVYRDGRGRVTQAHHHLGYDQPLSIIWLCQPHHDDVHHRGLVVPF